MPSLTLTFIGALFLLLGIVLNQGYPSKMNPVIGYRTERAIKNEESWKIANTYFGRCLIVCGGVNVAVGLLTFKLESSILLLFNVIVLFSGIGLSIYLTERRLKREE